MQQLTFDRNKANYDRFERFSISSNEGWLEFETGEVCYTHEKPDPEYRKYYPKYNTTIFMSGDNHGPDMYDPTTDKKIPAAQLSWQGSSRYLVVDHDYKKVKHLNRLYDNTQLPKQLRHATAYWAAPDSEVMAAPIEYYPPNTLTKEQKEFLKGCHGAASMVLALRSSNHELNPKLPLHTCTTQAAIQTALEQDMQPMVFLDQFGTTPLLTLKNAPADFIIRTLVTIPFAVLKEG